MELPEDRGDVVTGVGEGSGLIGLQESGRCAVEDAVAVISSGRDVSVDQVFCSRGGE